jgi:hypothetical protein
VDPRPYNVIKVAKSNVLVEIDDPQLAPYSNQRFMVYDRADNVVTGCTIKVNSDDPHR